MWVFRKGEVSDVMQTFEKRDTCMYHNRSGLKTEPFISSRLCRPEAQVSNAEARPWSSSVLIFGLWEESASTFVLVCWLGLAELGSLQW